MQKISQTAEQKRHRLAEFFAEFIAPELREQGIRAELRAADIPGKLVTVALKNALNEQPRVFIENIFRKFIDKRLSVRYIPF